jgi:succinyl-diaminopimelate desuccinylase
MSRESLLGWIERDRDLLVDFLSRFIRVRSPNPPGDTREAAQYVQAFLDAEALPYRVIAPEPTMPNIVASFDGGAGAGRHLVLNGHMDVFPVGDARGWSKDPWGGEVSGGRVWGRGACDMKCGTTVSIFVYRYLSRLVDRLPGRLTLTVVSDEETFGEWGARYLIANHKEVHGDCCLNAEPSSPYTIRFGEKGMLWLRFTVRARGGHSAYPHTTDSATKIAVRLIGDLEALTALPVAMPDNVRHAIAGGRVAIDRGLGAGATDIMDSITTNVGVLSGGLKINMIPDECTFEYDVRLPIGTTRDMVMAEVERIIARHPGASVREINTTPPSWCDPQGDMAKLLQANVQELRGFTPPAIVSLGGTDARLWRYIGVPAYVYGPSPASMGGPDEFVDIEEFLHILRTHALSAYDYLTRAALSA